MLVGELIELLQGFGANLPVICDSSYEEVDFHIHSVRMEKYPHSGAMVVLSDEE